MPEHSEERTLPRGEGKTPVQYAKFAEPDVLQPSGRSSKRNGRHVSCEIPDGLPSVVSKAGGHYVSRKGGSRMLVLDCRPGERLRINGTTEVVILEIQPGKVKIAIETSPDDETKPQGAVLSSGHECVRDGT
ncbi:MAG: carbon storage regulator [Planctomycetota bacterium]